MHVYTKIGKMPPEKLWAHCLLLFLTLISPIASNRNSSHHEGDHKRHKCGGVHHAEWTRPCPQNDTFCGTWNGRWWNPLHCHYLDITTEQARQCLGEFPVLFIAGLLKRKLSQVIEPWHSLAILKFEILQLE